MPVDLLPQQLKPVVSDRQRLPGGPPEENSRVRQHQVLKPVTGCSDDGDGRRRRMRIADVTRVGVGQDDALDAVFQRFGQRQ
ncbi:hypothetical protein GCM10010439_41410 [Actinocorallia aurantiaca]|uniref:Uncharacterized protein n=1 Tax=Actinocorallia aurantiaca TaxID=46204 RepID=A0ABP6GR96_9ACTN